MRLFVAQPLKYGYQIHRTLKACSVLLCSLSPRALDGLTVFVNAPTASEAENVLAYYSGHYKHDSLNVQALSDYRGKFLYFAVAAPGSFPDSNALGLH